MLTINEKFPNFSLPNQDSREVSLDEFAGKWLVLFVYPKDDTPGCTLESKSFSAAKDNFEKANIEIVGVSADDTQSHTDFFVKYGLTVDLLSDTEGSLMKKAKVNQLDYNGDLYWERTTFIIDPHGILRKVYAPVMPEGHEKQVLHDVLQLQNEYGVNE